MSRLRDETQSVEVRHYLISSGLMEIIQGTSIFDKFHNVFASEYWFEAYDMPYPKRVITDTGKTQYLFRINKGIEDLGQSINHHMPEDAAADPVRQHDLLRRRRHRRAVDGGGAQERRPCHRRARARTSRRSASICSRPGAAISLPPPTIAARSDLFKRTTACCSTACWPTSACRRRSGP